ncbi:MAG: ABC transporter permease [Candidatus Zambryskibacteria bacterium]|nr:ABC transporter permease [Candidatus Zambryskibacteria bacterium]
MIISKMDKQKSRISDFLTSLKVGFFLALRQIKRSSKATTALIIFVMTLTFLNLVVVRGVLVGLIQGVVDVQKEIYFGDIFVSTPQKKDFIENSPKIISVIGNLPWVENFSARYTASGRVEGTYKDRIDYTEKANEAGAIIAGIDPEQEDSVSRLSEKVVEGSYLTKDDTDSVLIGAYLLKKYLEIESSAFQTLENVDVGDKIRLTVGGNTREFTVKGVVKTKVDEIDLRVMMLDTTLRNMIGRTDYNVNEISIMIKDGTNPYLVKDALVKNGVDKTAKVQTFEEGMPKFVEDMINTFSLLGNIIGSIGLVVASITIFIVIFVNAITRKKFIGILKGIGLSSVSIEIAYVFQSLFYAILGVGVGLLILYGFLVPFIEANPIPFPFSDGILVAEVPATMFRVLLLSIATIIAGYVPARIVVKKNTLDSILGR